MATQKYQHSDPPAEEPACLPFKKRVLKAFVEESSAISAVSIPLFLRKTSYRKGKEKVTAAEQLKADLDLNKEYQESSNVAPANIPKEKEEPSSITPEDSPIPSWGDVSPAALINNWVNIRMDKDDYVAFLIGDYDAETEMHQLVTSTSQKKLEDPCDWIDIRYFPPEDIVWHQENPGIPTQKCILKPGQTILHATSTAREKKPIKEVRKAASGIPILSIDKQKSIG